MGRPKAIVKLQDTKAKGNRNWLIYAPSGTGKTVFAGTAPRSLFLTVEAAGTESAKALGSDADEWVISSWKELQDAYKWLKKEGHALYDWVTIDSLTEMEELCWNDQLESINKEFEARIQDYGIVDRKIKKLVDQFNRLPVNVIMTAQMATMELFDDDDEEIQKRIPAIGRAKNGWPLSSLIQGKATLIGLLTVSEDDDENEYRRLWVHGGEKFVAKDRHDTFGRVIDNPNVAEMDEMISARQAAAGPKAVAETTKKKKKKES